METENTTPAPVPFAVYECAMARQQEDKKKLFTALILAVVLLFLSNVGWLIYESQFYSVSYQQDGGGMNNINTGEQGGLYYNVPNTENEEETIWQGQGG